LRQISWEFKEEQQDFRLTPATTPAVKNVPTTVARTQSQVPAKRAGDFGIPDISKKQLLFASLKHDRDFKEMFFSAFQSI